MIIATAILEGDARERRVTRLGMNEQRKVTNALVHAAVFLMSPVGSGSTAPRHVKAVEWSGLTVRYEGLSAEPER
ncbi:hypothetical protein E1286_18235 [Nonomuraea terrae]|uniref:Uncharacterized protein n=1 Tax=Nonomuraea terrae TaxID=2530383 RepID=A0A4R4YPW6_9ACTN|nr:hypothetical protein [Nonomuraea terrae]TDD47218.1 hypothetical protein E1286_18235 [Nonomuraea terrae]